MNTMAMRGGKRTRPLGAVRHMMGPDDSKIILPKLNISPKTEEEKGGTYVGIQGNAMTLPTPKESYRSEDRRRSTPISVREPPSQPKSASNSSHSAVSHEACEKDLKEVLGRERELKDKLAQMQRQVEVLTARVAERDGVIQHVTAEKEGMEASYKDQLAAEVARHAVTQEELESTQLEIAESIKQLEAQEKESKEKMDLIRLDLNRQMTEMTAAKDKEIADKDQKLNRLKMQMADALKGNSWERQQQLEELTKDLAKIQEECDMLRSKLKTLAKAGKAASGPCGNCAEAQARAEKLAVVLKEREVSIRELKALTARFEKQLSQQDVLLKQWADSKGHKVTLPK